MDVKLEEFKNWHISSQVIKLISVCSEASEIIGATSAPNLDSEGDKHDIKDDMQKLIAHSRGVDEKVNMLGLDDWALVDVEFNCSSVVKLSHITTWLREGSLGKKICQDPSETWNLSSK